MTKTINEAKTLNATAAKAAINQMINEMVGAFESISCNPTKIEKNQFGSYEVAIYINGNHETATLYRNGNEFIAIADIYCGEKTTFVGSQGGMYTFNDNSYLVAA